MHRKAGIIGRGPEKFCIIKERKRSERRMIKKKAAVRVKQSSQGFHCISVCVCVCLQPSSI